MSEDLFGPMRVADVRLEDKIKELRREIAVRKRVYPRWVQAGKLNGPLADYRIRVLRAILKDYENQAKAADDQRPRENQDGNNQENPQEGRAKPG